MRCGAIAVFTRETATRRMSGATVDGAAGWPCCAITHANAVDARSRTAPYKSQAGIVNAMHHLQLVHS